MSVSLFFTMWFLVIALAHWYVGWRLIGRSKLPKRGKIIGWGTVVFVFGLTQVIFLLRRNESVWLDGLSWLAFILLGAFSLVVTFLLIRDIVYLVVRIVQRKQKRSAPEADRGRRRFIIHSSNIGLLGLAAVTTGYGVIASRRRAAIEQVEIELPNLPDEFDGFRIVQFTDLHVGPTIKRPFVETVVDQLQSLNGDLVVFTGDLVDGSVSWLRDDVAPLGDISAPYGKLFITGNHEYYSGAGQWVNEAERLGFQVLLNEHTTLSRRDDSIVVAGVTDYGAGDYVPDHRSDPLRAFEGAPGNTVRILLAHQPRTIFATEALGIDLQISGHTHGGQFFPWNHLAALNQPYVQGKYRHGNTWVYVSRGTGYWGPPLRVGIPPEVTVLTLRKKSSQRV